MDRDQRRVFESMLTDGKSLIVTAVILVSVTFASAAPLHMNAIQASGTPCERPDWACITDTVVTVPHPKSGHMLVKIKGANVNPINLELVESTCRSFGHCSNGTIGSDGSGVVIQANDCEDFKNGDEVWMLGGIGADFGDYEHLFAEYAVIPCSVAGLKPIALSFIDAGTIPLVGVTSLRCLQAASVPLTNLTVVITSGQGGTGFIAVQLAKALGAARVITAATGEGIGLMKLLGADLVIDFHKQDIFDALDNGSVDIVFDNLGFPGTADKAMQTLRSGGFILMLPTVNGGQPSEHPKDDVRQVFACAGANMGRKDLDILAKLFDAGRLHPHTMSPIYDFTEIRQAFNRLLSPGVLGKIAIVPTSNLVLFM